MYKYVEASASLHRRKGNVARNEKGPSDTLGGIRGQNVTKPGATSERCRPTKEPGATGGEEEGGGENEQRRSFVFPSLPPCFTARCTGKRFFLAVFPPAGRAATHGRRPTFFVTFFSMERGGEREKT